VKLVINDPKTGKSYQRELEKEKDAQLIGKKVRDPVEGSIVGLTGYQLQITGGSDKDGFPISTAVPGTKRYSVLLTGGTGVRGLKKGQRSKMILRGCTISQEIMQVNTKITAYGEKPLEELGFVVTPKEKKPEEKKEEKKGKKKKK